MKVRVTHVVLVVCLVVLLLAGAIAVGSRSNPVAAALAIGALFVAVAIFHHEWARDREAAAMFAVVIGATTVIVCGSVVALFDDSSRSVAGAVGASALVVTAWLGVVLWREARFEDLVPDWLLSEFPREIVFEDDGVEWCVQTDGTNVSDGVELRVLLQNNIEAPRDVTLTFRDESGFFARSGQVRVSTLRPVPLEPRAHAAVTVAVTAVHAHPIRELRLFVFVSASGPAAGRNRRRRAGPGPRPIPFWIAVLGPLAGHFVFRRGGVFARLQASGGPPPSPRLVAASVRTLSSALPR